MQLKQGQSLHDHQFITDLYQRSWLMILTNMLARVPLQQDAEDVLLEVFLAALESDTLRNLSERQQLAWLRRVAHNKCVDYHRRSIPHSVVSLETSEETLYDNEKLAPEQVALQHEELALLRARFSSLSTIQQEILLLRFADPVRKSKLHLTLSSGMNSVRITLNPVVFVFPVPVDRGDRPEYSYRRDL